MGGLGAGGLASRAWSLNAHDRPMTPALDHGAGQKMACLV